MGPDEIIPLTQVTARLSPYEWSFVREKTTEIDAFWTDESASKPNLFNGRVLLQHHAEVENGVFHAQYFETDYKPFLAWQRLGYPGPALRNGFAMAALRSRDGAYLLGRMGAHTANAGRIYFPAGTPDLDDVRADGTVDLAGSVLRELKEETGLGGDEITVGEGWLAVMDAVRVAFMRPVGIDLLADEARALMLARIAAQPEPELDDVVIIRNAAGIVYDTAIMPRFMQRYLARMLG